MSRPRLLVLVLAGAVVAALAGLGLQDSGLARGGDHETTSSGPATDGPVTADPARGRPNVIMILTDDLDTSLMKYMPNVRHLIRDQGADLTNFYVEQSSCCPSRASILSGLYAHNHGVIGNAWPEGGYDRWKETEQDNDLPVWLEAAGYRSALMGKYFNEYPFHHTIEASDAEREKLAEYVPPGWQDWASPVKGNAYAQMHYKMNVNGEVDADFHDDYLDTWLGDRALSVVDGADGFDFAEGGQFLYYASYSPHTPYAFPASLKDSFSDVRYPRTPAFDEADVSDKFGLTRTRPPLSAAAVAEIDRVYRDRVRSVQELDHNVAKLVQELEDEGALDNTYLMFTSDNGYIMGDHRREIGKYNQFQQTVSVPFYVRGPGIAAGQKIADVAGNIDIAPTIADIAGATPPADVDGVSLLPLLTTGEPLARRYFLLGRALTPTNTTAPTPLDEAPEDYVEGSRSSRLNDFTGVVNGRFKLIRYTHIPHEELYDLNRDPYELDNLLAHDAASYDAMSPAARSAVDTLRQALDRLTTCSGANCQ